MKKFLILIIYFFSAFEINAQVTDTIQYELPLFSDTTSKLKKAKGWLLQNDGIWVSSKNRIPNDRTTLPYKLKEFSLGKENFSSIEFTPFIYDKISYILMVIYYTDGYYDMPSLKSDWKTDKAANFYIFERNKLYHLIPDVSNLNKPYSVNLNIICSGYINIDKQKLSLKNIVTEIFLKTRQKVSENYINLIFSVFYNKSSDTESVKFKIIKTYLKKSIYEYYLLPKVQEDIFAKSFYEAEYEDFNNFIIQCLSAGETYKKQKINFNDTLLDENNDENYKSNYNEVRERLKSFGKEYESLKVDTTNFYSAPKISKYADTVAATSYIKPLRKTSKTIEKTNIYYSDSLKISGNNKFNTNPIQQSNSDTLKPSLILDSAVTKDTISRIDSNVNNHNLIYRIQIENSTDKNRSEFLRKKYGIKEEIYIIKLKNTCKYTLGEFNNINEAKAYKAMIADKYRIINAFIIAEYNGKLISLNEAAKIENVH